MNFQFKNFQKLFIFTLLFFGIFGLVKNSFAACTGLSPNWTATPDYDSVNACITNAIAEDTINVSAGTATWDSTLAITKSITLLGAGDSNTKIIRGAYALNGSMMRIALSADAPVRISGIYFDQLSNASGGGYRTAIYVAGKTDGSFGCTQIRVDNNTFNKGNTVIWWRGWAQGVIDSNNFINNDRPILIAEDNNYSWNRPIEAGTSNALFIENNMFTVDNNTDREPNHQIYHQEGGRTVTRYNTFDFTYYTNGNALFYDSHGNWGVVAETPTYRGQPILEVYSNIMKGHHSYEVMDFRGGSILFHHNTVLLITGTPYISLREEESWTSGGLFCPSCPKFTIWPSWDNITNSFFWENTFNSVAVTDTNYANYLKLKYPAEETEFIQKDRDYFIHAPQNSGGKSTYPTTPGKYDMTFSSSGANAYYPYTAYTCPHPLTGLTGACDTSLAGTVGYNVNASDTTPPAAPNGLVVN